MSDKLLSQGIYVIGFSYPIRTPKKDQAVFRCQSGSHSLGDIDRCGVSFVSGKGQKLILYVICYC